MHADSARQFQLGADAVGGSDENGIGEPGGGQVKQAAEPAKGHIRARAPRARRIGPDITDQRVAGVDIDPGIAIAEGISRRSFV